MSETAAPTLFFQSSLPRAGSTLLQNILAQNPAFYATPTSGALELIFGARQAYTIGPEFRAQDAEMMRKAFLAFCREGMYGYFRALTDKPYIIDKSRGWGVHFDLLSAVIEHEPKIICMVRDLRQILASMEKKFRETPERHRGIEHHSTLQGTTTLKRVVAGLQSAPVGLALDRLAEIHQRGWNRKMLFTRYEDLTTRPVQTLQTIYSYLGVAPFTHDFDRIEQVTHEDDEVYGTPGLHAIREKVQRLPDDYVTVLGRDAVRFVEETYGWYFTLFRYPLSQ
jgi:sulfotransferase